MLNRLLSISLSHNNYFSASQAGLRDEPAFTKHAQEGATWEDYSRLHHSGFGPFCNAISRSFFPDAHQSLVYFTSGSTGQKRTVSEWFHQRAECNKLFIKFAGDESKAMGFCTCCSFTTSDAIFNALAKIQNEWSDSIPLLECFEQRVQEGFWFPRVQFHRWAKC